jgi:hypothetical protein
MTTRKTLKDIEKLSKEEVDKLVDEILNAPEKPTITYSSRGVGYVHPFDNIASKSGRETLRNYLVSAARNKKRLEPA